MGAVTLPAVLQMKAWRGYTIQIDICGLCLFLRMAKCGNPFFVPQLLNKNYFTK